MSTPSVTPNIGLQIPATGSNNWYIPVNYNFNKIDQYLGGQIAIPNLTVTNLTVTNFALNAADITNALGYVPLNPANNLSELVSASAALNNLGAIGASSIKGAWSSATTYNLGDVAFEGPITYVSIQPTNLNHDPATSPTFWAVFVNSTGGGGITALTGDVTASGSASVAATVVGINGVVLSALGAGIYKFDASGVPSVASTATDYVAPNTDATLTGLIVSDGGIGITTDTLNFTTDGISAINFPNGSFVQETVSPNNLAIIANGGVLLVGGAMAVSLTDDGVNTLFNTAIFAGVASLGSNNCAIELRNIAATGYLIQTAVTGQLIDSGNAYEIQLGVGANSGTTPPAFAPSFGIGDAVTTISNTSIKLIGQVGVNSPKTIVSGSTSGSATFSQPETGDSYKRVIVYCSALLGTAAYTFPVPFLHTPNIILFGSTSNLSASETTTGVTLTGTVGGATGFVIIEGF